MVFGVTSSRSPWRCAFGIRPSRAASRARSAQFSLGRRGSRCKTATWWRRIKISAAFHASSRRDSRSHVASRVIRRKTNRRHMTGEHHGQSAGRATLLVRAVDEILGTHRWRGPAPYLFVAMTPEGSEDLKEAARGLVYWGQVPVHVTIGGTGFTTALFPKEGRYLVPVKVAVQRAEALGEGAIVEVVLRLAAARRE
jgi:hypothetical protein